MNVWKFGGAVCLDRLDDIAIAIQTAGPMAILHGAGPQLDAALAKHGTPERVAGLRVTPPAAAQTVLETMDSVGAQMVAGLQARGIDAVHVPAASGWLSAVCKIHPDGDLQRVGTPLAVDATAIRNALSNGQVPVATPVGMDPDGPLNINADEAAQALASALPADALNLVTDVPHVRGEAGRIDAMTPEQCEALIASGIAAGGMVPKLRNACNALGSGVDRVVIGTIESLAQGQGTSIVEKIVVAA